MFVANFLFFYLKEIKMQKKDKMDECLLECKTATSECYKNMCKAEKEITNNNEKIELLSQKLKHLKIQFDKKLSLKYEIPNLDEVSEQNKRNKYRTKEDAIAEYIDMKAKYSYQTEKLREAVLIQQNQIKALKKILIPYLIEQIKTKFEENDAYNELNQTESVLKEVKKQIEVKSKEKDKMFENYFDNVKGKLADIKLQMVDNRKEKIKDSANNLDYNRKAFYEQKLEHAISLKKNDLIKDYTQKLIMGFLQSSGDLDKISYEDVANKLAGNRQDLKNIMNKTMKSKFTNLLKDSEDVIFKTELCNENDLKNKNNEIKNIYNQGKAKKDQLSEKIAQLNKISNEVNDALSLKLVSNQKMYQREITGEDEKIISNDIMRNIKNENVKEQYICKTYSYAERVNQYKQNIDDYKILIDELIKKFPVQNQNHNHGIFNMINNGQNQNDNDIPQMENNIINEK